MFIFTRDFIKWGRIQFSVCCVFKIYFCFYLCVFECVLHMCACLQWPEEGLGSFKAGVSQMPVICLALVLATELGSPF